MASKDGRQALKIARLMQSRVRGTSYYIARLADVSSSYAYRTLEALVLQGKVEKTLEGGKYLYQGKKQ